MAEPDPLKAVGAVLVIVLAGALVAYLFATLGGTFTQSAYTADVELVGGNGTLPGEPNDELALKQSLGTAYRFDGSGGVSGDVDLRLGEDSSLCTWARPAAAANGTNMTVATYESVLTLQYHGDRPNASWVGRYYNVSRADSADVLVPANETGTLTLLCLKTNGTHVTLTANASASRTASQNLTTETSPDTYQVGADPFTGDIDETRVFTRTVSSAEETSLHTDPTAALVGAPADIRVMYDSRDLLDGKSGVAFYRPGNPGPVGASASGALVVPGLPEVNSTVGVDYTISADMITILGGGNLEDAPVVFVNGVGVSGGAWFELFNFLKGLTTPIIIILAIALFAIAGRFVNQSMR